MSAASSYPQGPLSLLYHLTNTPDVRGRFKADPSTVLEEFALSANAQNAIKAAGDDLTADNIAAVLAVVHSEVQERAELMW